MGVQTIEYNQAGAVVATAFADVGGMTARALRVNGMTFLAVGGHVSNPLTAIGPAIDYDYTIAGSNDGRVLGMFGGHDRYPSHSVYYSFRTGMAQQILDDRASTVLGPLGLPSLLRIWSSLVVTLRSADSWFDRTGDMVFVAEGQYDVQIQWHDDSTLLVQCDACAETDIFKQKAEWQDVKIEYGWRDGSP